MKAGKDNTREIVDPAEIEMILQAAYSHEWQFYYLSMVRNHLSSHSTRLRAVDHEAGTITVNGDILDVLSHSMTNMVFFRARSGGISVIFKSTLVMPSEGIALTGTPEQCQFEFPDSLQLTQQRKAIRINFKDREEIPVTLFLDLEQRFQGKVADISETGTRIVFEGNLANRLEGSEIITDCQMLLPDESCIENQVRVLGVVYDADQDLSYFRCEYVDINMKSEARIKELIAEAVDDMNQLDLVLAS